MFKGKVGSYMEELPYVGVFNVWMIMQKLIW
jgi:hypothetical protein